jgi:hypothetical protein
MDRELAAAEALEADDAGASDEPELCHLPT